MSTYVKNVSEPWFSLIKLGIKKCEGRLQKGDFVKMRKGDHVVFTNDQMGFDREVNCKITSIHSYISFKEYLETEGVVKCLPGIDTLEEGLQVYYTYYSTSDEMKYGICAIRLQVLK
jgi:ASC-1-like (ASCH) protein